MPMLEPDAELVAIDLDILATAASSRSAKAAALAGCGPSVAISVNSSPPRRARKASSAAAFSCRELAQQRVARRVAEHVIDLLEAVEVDAQQGEAFLVCRRAARASAVRRSLNAARFGRSVSAS